MTVYIHPLLESLVERLSEPRRFIQVLLGPRQVGKTTLARQAIERLEGASIYATADGPLLEDLIWLEQQWERARHEARRNGEPTTLVLDEVQKIPGWSEVVKRLWDQDSLDGRDLRVLLLGSSPLLMEQGLGESLAGRFEVLRLRHWGFAEMAAAFGSTLEDFLVFGGYPGAASLTEDAERFRRYILDALIEPVIGRDILVRTRVDKPVLLRRLFRLGCDYSAQVLSYQRMLGELLDRGNTTTLAHYLELLEGAGLLAGLQKFADKPLRRRASSPKLLVLNTALMSAVSVPDLRRVREDPPLWGRLVETAVGAHLVNSSAGSEVTVYYWREGNLEVDFVLAKHGERIAIEVKSGAGVRSTPGLEAFDKRFAPRRKLLVGSGGLPLEEFLRVPAARWFED